MKKTLILIGALLTLTSCQALQQIAAELSAQSDSISSASYSSSSGSIFSSSSSDEDTTIAYRQQKENRAFALSRPGQKHTYYINVPDTEDYEIRNGRIEFEVDKSSRDVFVKHKIKGIFFNKSDFKYKMEIQLISYLADGSIYNKKSGFFEFIADDRTDINYKSYDYIFNTADLDSGLLTNGNKLIYPLNEGVIIKLYKGDKLVYSSNQRIPKKSEAK